MAATCVREMNVHRGKLGNRIFVAVPEPCAAGAGTNSRRSHGVLPHVPEIASAAGVQGQVKVSAKVDLQKGRSPILKQQQAGKSCATLQQQNIQK
jgi:hypothetical protein